LGCHAHDHAHDHTHEATPPERAPEAEATASNAEIASEVGSAPPDGTPTLDAVARNPKDPASFEAAIAWQDDAHSWMNAILREAISAPPSADPNDRGVLLRNTAQWIAGGQARVTLFTRTHDAHLRPGIDEKDALWFQSSRSLTQGPGTYRPADDGVDDRTGLLVRRRSARGTMEQSGTKLDVFGPKDKRDLEETLIHEVQHDADQSHANEHGHAHFQEDRDKEIPGGDLDAMKAGMWVYNRYKSEFRAYWIGQEVQGEPSSKAEDFTVWAEYGASGGAVRTSFKNGRQSAIFKFLHRSGAPADRWLRDDDTWYPRNAYSEFFHYYVFDAAFRAMVDDMAAPIGGNVLNSLRVQALSDAIVADDPDGVRSAARALEDADRAFLSDKKASGPFWAHAAKHLRSVATLDDLLEVVDAPIATGARGAGPRSKGRPSTEGAGPPNAAPTRVEPTARETDAVTLRSDASTWIVQRGDTLGDIAAAALGDPRRWPEIHRLNRDVVKDPDRLRRGMVLRLPER